MRRADMRWRRIAAAVAGVLAVALVAYALWRPGRRDVGGRYDRGANGIWMGHGWLGHASWFVQNRREAQRPHFHKPESVRATADRLRAHHVRDVFPHLCPSDELGELPPEDPEQAERFLDAMAGFRVIPWIGGVWHRQVFVEDAAWRARFVRSATALLARHPRFAGVHVNIEPCPSGDAGYLRLLDELRAALPPGTVLSVAAYPPPFALQPGTDVHWSREYYRAVAQRSDQVAVMMYDTGLRLQKPYVRLMESWTLEVLDGVGRAQVLLGVPAYDDHGVPWHDPAVENLANAIDGIHAGLARGGARAVYQGLAIYSEWEMDAAEWRVWRERFLAP